MSDELQKQEETEPKLFTQEEVDKIVGQARLKERSKYSQYEEYKTAYDELQSIKEQGKTELQKATERAEAAEKERDALLGERQKNAWIAEVSEEYGVPRDLLHGADLEAIKESAAIAKRYLVDDGVVASDGFSPSINTPLTAREQFINSLDDIF